MRVNGVPKLAALIPVLIFTGSAFAVKVPRGMQTCRSLEQCLTLLATVVPAQDDGEGGNSRLLATYLERFGEPAKRELLRKATGSHPGWRNVAGAILSEWASWSSSDVPMLREALRKQPGGWVARPLGQIGTPEAIEALVEDLPKSDSGNQTDGTLAQLGGRAIPYLFPLLEDTHTAPSAMRVIADMKPAPVSFVATWVQIATDSQKRLSTRIAALKGIAAIGYKAQPECVALRQLLTDTDSELRKQAADTLRAVRDPAVVADVAQSCHPSATQFDSLAIDSLLCLREIASFGSGAQSVGDQILPFLRSANGAERAYGTITLGLIGYAQAVPDIERELTRPDWRVVYAAVRSLGWLGATSAIPSVERVASDYWFPEVREEAQRVAFALHSPMQATQPPSQEQMSSSEHQLEHDPFDLMSYTFGPKPACKGGQWNWKGSTFKFSSRPYHAAVTLRFRDGSFVGTNHGEWGGELAWLPQEGQPLILLRNNVLQLEHDGEGAIALFGGLKGGYAIRMSRNGSSWDLMEVARFPTEPDDLVTVDPGLFAVMSSGRAFVFSSNGKNHGVASCVPK